VVIGLKIVDDAGIIGLDLGHHIGRKVQDTCVSQLDFAVNNMKVKCI
jgi:hypothetical protein